MLSELISNALRHATPLPDATVRVAWWLDGNCLEIAVSDGGGPTVPAVNEPGSSAIGGRGLGIVDRLSLRWGVDTSPDGDDSGSETTTVWAEIALGLEREDEHADTGNSADDPEGWSPRRGPGHGADDDGLVIASSRDA